MWVCSLCALALLAAAACGDDDDPNPGQAADVGLDAASDTPEDAPPDTPEDAPDEEDAAPDAPPADDPRDEVEVEEEVDPGPPLDAPLAAQGDWGPAGRITRLDLPQSADEGRAMGCLVFGTNVGAGMGNLVLLAGGLDVYLRPDAQGQIALLLMAQALGWPEGAPSRDLEQVELRFLDGVGGPAAYRVARSSFEGLDPAAPVTNTFAPQAVEGGWVDTDAPRFLLRLPVFGALVVQLPIEAAHLSIQLWAEGPGMGARGVLTGYILQDTVLELIRQVQAACMTEPPPGICALFGNQINQPAENLLPTVVGFVQGYDTRVTAGVPWACDPTDPEPTAETACNAVSACLRFEMEGIAIEGVQEAP